MTPSHGSQRAYSLSSDTSNTAAPKLDLAETLGLRIEYKGGERYLRCESADSSISDLAHFASKLASHLTLVLDGKSYPLDTPLPKTENVSKAVEASISLAGVTLAAMSISQDSVTVRVERPLTSFDTRQLARLAENGKLASRYLESFSKVKDLQALPTRRVDLHTHFAGELASDKLVSLGIEHNSLVSERQLNKWGLTQIGDAAPWTADPRGGRKIGLGDYLQAIETSFGANHAKAMRAKIESRLSIPTNRTIPFRELSKLYDEREFICQDPKLFRPILWEIAKQYQELGVEYAELSLSPITNPQFLRAAHEELPKVEEATGVRVRFLAGLRRTDSPENLEQLVNIIKHVAHRSPYVVGADFMGHETNSTKEFAKSLKSLKEFKDKERPDFQIRVHAGENARYAENVIAAIELGATRIGHGLRGVDDRVFEKAREKGVVMELNLNSNAALNNLIGTNLPEEVVIGRYLEKGIRVTLGSDGSGAYQAGGRQETYAAIMCGLSDDELEQIGDSDARYIEEQRAAEKVFCQSTQTIAGIDDSWFDSIPSFNPVSQRAKHAEHFEGLSTALSQSGVNLFKSEDQTDSTYGEIDTLQGFIGDRPVIAFSGASKTFKDLPESEQIKVDQFVREIFSQLHNEELLSEFVFVTGGTNVGVEALVHKYARQYGVPVVGVLSESTSGSIEPNTITHAAFAGRGWYDVLPAQIDLVEKSSGSMVFISGGDIVKDAIQAAKNSAINFMLLDGVGGASSDKVSLYPNNALLEASDAVRVLKTIDSNSKSSRSWHAPGTFEVGRQPLSLDAQTKGQDARTTMEAFVASNQAYAYLCSLKNDVAGHSTVGQHTEAVMNQLLRYPFDSFLRPEEIKLLKGLIACHDLEKYPEYGERDRTNVAPEHERAESWLRRFAPSFGLSEHEIEVAATLVKSEAVGDLMRSVAPARPESSEKQGVLAELLEKPLVEQGHAYREKIEHLYQSVATSRVSTDKHEQLINSAALAISQEAARCGLTPSSYLLLAMAFYQSDCSTYTADSVCESSQLRGELSMEFLFELAPDATLNSPQPTLVFDARRGRLKMRGVFEVAMRDLEAAVARLDTKEEFKGNK